MTATPPPPALHVLPLPPTKQDAVARIEEQLSAFRRASEAAQLEAASLRSHLEHLTASEESARLEAKVMIMIDG